MRTVDPNPDRDAVSDRTPSFALNRWARRAASAAVLVLLAARPAVANSAERSEDVDTPKAAEPAKASSFQVQIKLPGAEAPIDAPSSAQVGTPLEWDVETDGKRHKFRVQLDVVDASNRVGVHVDYRLDESSLVEVRTEVEVASWASLETADGATLEVRIDRKKKRKKITIADGDNPLDGV
ncbi:MAG: hypothetical protein ACRBN8_43465 [Nannocystales bacterium]